MNAPKGESRDRQTDRQTEKKLKSDDGLGGLGNPLSSPFKLST
jgi:hypothetical protein